MIALYAGHGAAERDCRTAAMPVSPDGAVLLPEWLALVRYFAGVSYELHFSGCALCGLFVVWLKLLCPAGGNPRRIQSKGLIRGIEKTAPVRKC